MSRQASAGRLFATAGILSAALAATILTGIAAADADADSAAGDIERGAYLASIMDCGGCHSGRLPDGRIDANADLIGGTLGFAMPGLGTFYPPNLTPHETTGLGGWSDAEVIQAVREGVRPDGRILAPIMPWEAYAALTDADAADLVAYLRSLPPAENAVPGPFGMGEPSQAPYFSIVVPDSPS